MNSKVLLDKSTLERLRRLGDNRFLVELIDLFLEHTPMKINEALAGGKIGDWENVERAVHALKSSAGNLGALSLQDLAGQIEQLAERKEGDSIPELLKELQDEYERVCDRLKAIKKGAEY
ncbi:MAG: Hpt domain-containing protein [Fidelibacterota bacterium]|nr:MAG: Hpt domain-containing protein [Candidatus Neomarinimicrobiota bacterium]